MLIYLLDTAREKNAEVRRATDQHYSRETIPSPPLHPPERLQGDRSARGRVLRALIVLIVSDWGAAELGHRERNSSTSTSNWAACLLQNSSEENLRKHKWKYSLISGFKVLNFLKTR